jgi:hypothetical protein
MLSRLLFLLFILCSTLANAQQNSWGLTNTSNANLSFETFDPARGTWKAQSIYPNQSVNYSMSPGVTAGKFHIETKGRGFVEYQVLAGKKYTIGWNPAKDMWDMKFAPGYDAWHSPNSDNERNAGNAGNNRRDHARDNWQDNGNGNGNGNGGGGGERVRGDSAGVGASQHATSYKLSNASNEKLDFETLDLARGTWKKQDIFPNQTKAFTMSPGTSVGKIRIATDGRGFVEYDMRLGWSYQVLFDNRKGVWDVRTLQRGQ